MNTKRILLLGGGILGLALIGGGAWWWQSATHARAEVEAFVPPLPDVSGASSTAQELIHQADQRARSLRGARAGLAELSRVYHANGFLESAARCYEGLEQLDPREPRWPHRHATILAGYGEIEPAIALWQRVVELAPDYAPARIRLADALLKINRIDEAAATYGEVLRREPTNPHAQLGLARIDFEAQRWEQARQRLEPIVRQTNFELGYDLIVSLYERLGETARAAEIRGAMKASGAYRDPTDPWIDELLEVCYDPYRLSVAAGTMSRTARARSIELLERAIGLAPNDVSHRFQMGTMALQAGDLTAARAHFEQCTQIAPDFSDGWAQLSNLLDRMGDPAGAERTIDRGLTHCPNSPGLHLAKAQKHKQAGRVGEAIREYKRSAELRPNEADAYLELGNLFIGLGRNDEGMEQIELAVKAEPGNPMALSILTYNAILQGEEAEARRWFERVKGQPRVRPEQVATIRNAFEKQFGRAP